MTTFNIYINSGTAGAVTYTNGDNLSMLEVTNSDDTYFQSGFFELYDVSDEHIINDTVKVHINNLRVFSGYISRRERTIDKGKLLNRYQLVGETYDLWRYHTDEYALYSGATTYIASSLVGTYCENITADDLDTSLGANITDDLDLSNKTVGDAISELTKLDGYSFYVMDGNLHYYIPSDDEVYKITEPDVIEMNPIEEADEDIVNDVLVIGGSGYSTVTNIAQNAKSSMSFPNNVLVAQQFTLEDTRLTAVDMFLGRSIDPNAPDPLLFEIWENTETTLFEDDFDNWNYLDSGNNSYNTQISGSNLCLSSVGGVYKYSSQILSKTYLKDTQYMKIDLTDVVSSNHIFISGTNDGGTTWKTLTDGSWIDFESESSAGSYIKYKFSSNGYFTPRIDSVMLTISDESGGFDTLIFEDDFDNYTYLSSQSNNGNITLESGYLQLSGNTGNNVEWIRPDSASCGGLTDSEYSIDDDIDTYAGRNYDVGTWANWDFTFNDYVFINKGKARIACWKGTSTSKTFTLEDVYVSGLYTDGWIKVKSDNVIWTGVTPTYKEFSFDINSYEYYRDIKKVRLYVYMTGDVSDNVKTRLYDIQFYNHPDYRDTYASGNIKSNIYPILSNLTYLELIPNNVTYPHLITYSGTATSGTYWTKLEPNVKTEVDSGKYGGVHYFIHASGESYQISGSNPTPYTPKIGSITLKSYGAVGGGIPKSGSKIEWSDDISFTTANVPYPPSSTGWKTYSTPKLLFDTDYVGDSYWMILSHDSGSGEYWDYYYDPNSTYNGKILYSLNGGYTWSSNTTYPDMVPVGNIRCKFGWKQGDITATATNQESIDLYGRHFKKINDSTITKLEAAQTRADLEVSGMTSIPKKGSFVIKGNQLISNEYMISASLDNFGIHELFDIKSYTHRIDKRGYTTEILYGKHPVDVMQKISALEYEINK